MNTKYYIVQDGKSTGPFSLAELKEKSLTEDTLVWFDGLTDWKKIKDLPILKNQLSEKINPPVFNQEEYENAYVPHLSQPQPQLYFPHDVRPANYLAESIISAIFCLPTALIAIYNAVKVDKLYDQGRHAEAVRAANQAKYWFFTSVAIGVICFIFIFL